MIQIYKQAHLILTKENFTLKTVRRTIPTLAISLILWVVFTALISLPEWFFGQLILGLNLGGYLNIWKWTYIGALIAIPTITVLGLMRVYYMLFRIAKLEQRSIKEVEEAIWKWTDEKKATTIFETELQNKLARVRLKRTSDIFGETKKIYTVLVLHKAD